MSVQDLLQEIRDGQIQILDRLDQLEASRPAGDGQSLLSAEQVAARVGRSRPWVYDHRDLLGSIPMGDGPRPRLGFDSKRVDEYLSSAAKPNAESDPEPTRPRRRRPKAAAHLLPIKGNPPS